VRDDGIGIPSDALAHVFEMFSQVDRSIERTTGGLGIGLALVKGLVEVQGGTVSVLSGGPGRGSTFTVSLPIVTLTESAPGSSAEEPYPAAVGSRRILVVDDNHDAAESLATLLRLYENEVSIAHDGMEAIAVAETMRPDLILMDIGMPNLNGYRATQEIRRKPWGKHVIIVALTGWGQKADRERTQEAQFDGHLVKPVNLSDVNELLLKVEGRQHVS